MINNHIFSALANDANNVNKLVSFKNGHGIEFIATFSNATDSLEDDRTVVLGKVRMMHIQQQQNGTVLGSLIPYSNSNPDGDLTFSTSDIVAVYTPIADVERDYMASTSSISLTGA